MREATEQFQLIVQRASADPQVVGLFLGGSRGKGFKNESSDYDICVVVADGTPAQIREQYEHLNSETIDIWTYSLSEIRAAPALL